MTPIINVSELDGNMFTIYPVHNLESQISYMDTNFSSMTTPASPARGSLNGSIYPDAFSISMCSKSIILDKFNFTINNNICTDEQLNVHIKSIINNEIRSKFMPIILELGNKNRESIKKDTRHIDFYDIVIEEIDKKYSQESYNDKPKKIKNHICSRIVGAGSYIAMNGRIGPPNFYVSNSKTHNFIYKYIYELNNMTYEIDNSIKEDCIILGRINQIHNDGVHCFVFVDEQKNIVFDKIETPSETKYTFYYSIEPIGSSVESQYLTLHTQSLSDYRREKIKKINNSINEKI